MCSLRNSASGSESLALVGAGVVSMFHVKQYPRKPDLGDWETGKVREILAKYPSNQPVFRIDRVFDLKRCIA